MSNELNKPCEDNGMEHQLIIGYILEKKQFVRKKEQNHNGDGESYTHGEMSSKNLASKSCKYCNLPSELISKQSRER